MALYIITHKYLEELIESKDYKYLFVGGYKENEKNNQYIYDDIGDNISKKNENYCELTGLYWIWKNTDDEFLGLIHYRRFFTHNSFSANSRYFYTIDELNELLNYNEIIVSEKIYLSDQTLYDDYVHYHYQKDIDNLKVIINDYFPDFIESFDDVFSKRYYNPANMFYTRKELLNEYCEWLFSVLLKYEKITDISNYNAQQARIYGFIAERLLNVWIHKKCLKQIELPCIQTDSSIKLRFRKKIDKVLKKSIRIKAKYEK